MSEREKPLKSSEDGELTSDMLSALLEELSEEGKVVGIEEFSDIESQRRRVREDLAATEAALVSDFTAQTVDVAELHKVIRAAEQTLGSVQVTLDSYEEALRTIAAQIEVIRAQSGDITSLLRNRRAAKAKLGAAIEAIVIPPRLVRSITEGDINEEYCKRLSELSRLASPPEQLAKSEAYKEASLPVTALLCSIAAMRIRDFLYQQLLALTKPGTNVQILQQSILDRYRPLNHFLVAHAPHYAAEIRENYVETMSPILQSYFVIYLGKLSSLVLPIGSRDDLLGATVTAKKKRLDDSSRRYSVFSLSNFNPSGQPSSAPQSRAQILEELDGPSIIPHVAEQHRTLFSYEHVYRSNLHLLVDTISAEYLFDVRWFRGNGPLRSRELWDPIRKRLFGGLFSKTLALFHETLSKFLPTCFDGLGLLLMIRIAEHSQMVIERRGLHIPGLDTFFAEEEEMIWVRFLDLMELQIASLKAFKAVPPFDTRPIFVRAFSPPPFPLLVSHGHPKLTRQYAELCASAHAIGVRDRKGEFQFVMKRMREQLEDALMRTCAHLTTPLARAAFLINNHDVIVTVLREHERKGAVMSEDAAQFVRHLETQKVVFVENVLAHAFPMIVNFARQRLQQQQQQQPRAAGSEGGGVEDPILDGMIRNFNATWKADLRKLSSDVMEFFPNFGLGSDVLRQVLGQFVVYYTQLEEAVRRVQRTRDASAVGGLAKVFIPLAAVTYEIRKLT